MSGTGDRILEIGRHAAGFCGRLFVRTGGAVTRIEATADAPGWASEAATASFLHRGKSIVSAADTGRLAALAATADVVIVEAPGASALEALGFAHWTTPIKVAITPFGLTGPHRNRQATQHVLLAMAGLTAHTGDPDAPPLSVPGHYLDYLTGQFAWQAAMACRLGRCSDTVDIAQLEVGLALTQFATTRWLCKQEVATRQGSILPQTSPAGRYRLRDGWLDVTVPPAFWDAFAIFIDQPTLVVDPRFIDTQRRILHRAELDTCIARSIATMTRTEAMSRARALRIPAGILQSLPEVLDDPHLSAREAWETVRLTGGLSGRLPNSPWRQRPLMQPREHAPSRDRATAPDGFLQRAQTPRWPITRSGDGSGTPPLTGLRVLDLTHVWAGPLAVRMLADLGAEVVRVEAPFSRGPREPDDEPYAGCLDDDADRRPWEQNAAFAKLMRNRQSVCVDLGTAAGRAVLQELATVVDVVMSNFSPGRLADLGLDPDALAAVNPALISLNLSTFGATGPLAEHVGFGSTVEPMSGLGAMLGYGSGSLRNSTLALPDPIAALNAANAVLAALQARAISGEGQCIDLSLYECAVECAGPWLLDQQLADASEIPDRDPAEASAKPEFRAPGPLGNRHPGMAPHGIYPCRPVPCRPVRLPAAANPTASQPAHTPTHAHSHAAITEQVSWIAIACTSEAGWQALSGLLGLDSSMGLPERHAQADLIDQRMAAWTQTLTAREVVALLQSPGLAAGPVNVTPDILADPHVRARGFFVPLDAGLPLPGSPLHMAGVQPALWTPCPKLGADNRTILRTWLGYPDSLIDELVGQGVLTDQPPE